MREPMEPSRRICRQAARSTARSWSRLLPRTTKSSWRSPEGEEFTVEELKAALRKGESLQRLYPSSCGSAYKNKGVQKLLDAVVDYLPAPTDVAAIKGTNPETGEETRQPSSDDEPFSALAFKIMTDPFVGKLTYFRVYSGKVEAGPTCTTPRTERAYRPHPADALQTPQGYRHLLRWRYRRCVGLKNTTTGDTLCDEEASHHPRVHEVPRARYPRCHRAQDQGRAGEDGHRSGKAGRRGPDLPTYTDEETGQTIIAGMGELHLEIIVDRLLREFKVEANVGAAPGCLPRDHPQDVRRPGASTYVSPVVAASTVTSRSRSSPTTR